MSVVLVAVGGALGAVLRHLVQHASRGWSDRGVPWGTLVVNVTGSLVLGTLVGAASTTSVPTAVVLALGVGLCGAFTTWSTAAWDAVVLVEDGRGRLALAWTAAEVAAGLLAAWAGWAAAVAVVGA